MPYHIGIDAGSKTIKIVVCDGEGVPATSLYSRHRSNIKQTLAESLQQLSFAHGDFCGTVAVTGSAGMGIAECLGVPFVQEVVATRQAVRALHPEIDVAIELGGEDAKILYLSDTPEQRMNATCAGGTGGFLDTIAFMLGVSTKEMGRLALGATHAYPIASRCAVFAQTDVRPLLNASVSKADIAGSALDAVVTQTLGGLACGRPIRGNVIFLGGPLEHLPALVMRFRKALGLNKNTGVKPHDAHLFTAIGAALCGQRHAPAEAKRQWSIRELLEGVLRLPASLGDLPRLRPLFESEEDLRSFRERHAAPSMPRRLLANAHGALYVGMDAGSTALKLAALDESGSLVYSDYRPVEGSVLGTSASMLAEFLRQVPATAYVMRSCVTGYGEQLLKAAFHFDSGVVETLAHAQAALRFVPDLSFLLDIGGQDMKALWFDEQGISDSLLNETCSSGCGSFIEGCAHSLGVSVWEFSQLALEATAPVDLGSKCTVFMTSRVRHAQKVGASKADIAAGICYSIVRNALQKVIGLSSVQTLEEPIVVQGGALKCDAVVRAFELLTGKNVCRPDVADIMGAIGCALHAQQEATAHTPDAASRLLGLDAMKRLDPQTTTTVCPFCDNACSVTIVDFGDGTSHVWGGRCERSLALGGNNEPSADIKRKKDTPPNVAALQLGLIRQLGSCAGSGERASIKVTLIPALLTYEPFAFWHGLLKALGFSLCVPPLSEQTGETDDLEAWESIPSESVCHPAKLVHLKLAAVIKQHPDLVFSPTFARGSKCPVTTGYTRVVQNNCAFLADEEILCISPKLNYPKPGRLTSHEPDKTALLCAINGALRRLGCNDVSQDEFECALTTALACYNRHKQILSTANDKALQWARESGHRGAILAGRSYRMDPGVLHGIDRLLQELGFAVILGNELDLPASKKKVGASPVKSGWMKSAHLKRLAEYAASEPSLELVCLYSFGCGYDAINLDDLSSHARKTGLTFTSLKIGDVADLQHIRIRLRTLAEMSKIRAARKADPSTVTAGARSSELEPSWPQQTDGSRNQAEFPLPANEPIRIERLEQEDVGHGRDCTPGEVCFVASTLAGSLIRRIDADSTSRSFSLPRVCETCLCDAVPNLVENSGHPRPELVWEGSWGDGRSRLESGDSSIDCDSIANSNNGSPRRVGLVGCPLLVFEEACNGHLHRFIESLGWEAVDPQPSLTTIEDTRFIEQLSRYNECGVRTVLYLQSFGCLKGHVNARGALRELNDLFPNMSITVIDFSPETSQLNRESRILLALSQDV